MLQTGREARHDSTLHHPLEEESKNGLSVAISVHNLQYLGIETNMDIGLASYKAQVNGLKIHFAKIAKCCA